jgi:hypothetical protein
MWQRSLGLRRRYSVVIYSSPDCDIIAAPKKVPKRMSAIVASAIVMVAIINLFTLYNKCKYSFVLVIPHQTPGMI